MNAEVDIAPGAGVVSPGRVGRPFRRLGCAVLAATALLLGGCASSGPTPQLDDDPTAFSAGIDEVLKIGMSIKDARAALRAKLPPPSMNTQVAAPVPNNRAMQAKRYMMAWPTLNLGTTLVVTIFCDRDGRVVRWTTGTLVEKK